MDAEEWLDWRVLESIDPFGQHREDLRVAAAVAVIVQALGGKKQDGTPFTAADYLTHLGYEAPLPSRPPPQTAAEIEALMRLWVSGSNRIMKHSRKGR